MMALVSCPTGSIGTTRNTMHTSASTRFRCLLDDNVYFCGFTSESSFGAWSYLIRRPEDEGGNILIDSPRFATQLVKRRTAMGGVKQMLLTHKDDVADHRLFAISFVLNALCMRMTARPDSALNKFSRERSPLSSSKDLLAIPTPGHTRGHVVYLYRRKYLFTGDHLAWSPNRQTLTAFRSVAWYSWPEQIRSMEKLLAYEFEWVLPGHGDIHHADVKACANT